jgi:hypothetical protein
LPTDASKVDVERSEGLADLLRLEHV